LIAIICFVIISIGHCHRRHHQSRVLTADRGQLLQTGHQDGPTRGVAPHVSAGSPVFCVWGSAHSLRGGRERVADEIKADWRDTIGASRLSTDRGICAVLAQPFAAALQSEPSGPLALRHGVRYSSTIYHTRPGEKNSSKREPIQPKAIRARNAADKHKKRAGSTKSRPYFTSLRCPDRQGSTSTV